MGQVTEGATKGGAKKVAVKIEKVQLLSRTKRDSSGVTRTNKEDERLVQSWGLNWGAGEKYVRVRWKVTESQACSAPRRVQELLSFS